jgi:autotransporter-associated beta strand protein
MGAEEVIPHGAGKGNVILATAAGGTTTLDLRGFSETINGLGNSGTGSAVIDNGVAGDVTLSVGANDATSSFNGVIKNTAGTLSLIKAGAGILTLAGANSYSGDTTVAAGTLSLAVDDSLSDAAALRLTTGAVLDLNFTGSDSVAAVYIDGILQPAGTWGSLDSSATNKTALITGTGLISVGNYDSWAGTNGVTGGPGGDHDQDGVPNLVEYALADGGELGSFSGGKITFTKRGAPYGGDVNYMIETSDDLSGWTPVTEDPPAAGFFEDATKIEYTLPEGETRIFSRLKVVQP